MTAIRAEISLRHGDLPEAERSATAALELLPPASWGVMLGLPLSVLIHTAAVRGRFDKALTHLRVPVPNAMFQTPVGLIYPRARGQYHMEAGRFPDALRDFERCGALAQSWNLDSSSLLPWRGDAAAACLRLGRKEDAWDLIDQQRRRLGPEHIHRTALLTRATEAFHRH